MINLSPGQVWAILLAVIGLILTILNIIDKAIVLREKAKQPQENILQRIEILESWQGRIESRLKLGTDHFEMIDKGNQVTHKALLALLDASINGDNLAELKKARQDLYDYMSGI